MIIKNEASCDTQSSLYALFFEVDAAACPVIAEMNREDDKIAREHSPINLNHMLRVGQNI